MEDNPEELAEGDATAEKVLFNVNCGDAEQEAPCFMSNGLW